MSFFSCVPKMHIEVPVLKRCCFCVPLRYGLITWAYVKLALGVLMGAWTVNQAIHYVTYPDYRNFVTTYQLIFAFISMLMNDAIIVILLVAAHRKNVRLLRVSYYGGIVALVVDAVIMILDYDMWRETVQYSPWLDIFIVAAFHALRMVIKVYVIILVRSEMIKLQDRSQFRFVNHASADAVLETLSSQQECTMTTDAAGEGFAAPGDDSCILNDTRQKLKK